MPTVFSLLEEVVRDEHGSAALAKINALDPEYHRHEKDVTTSEQLTRFMTGLSAVRDTPEGEAYFWAGKSLAPLLLKQLPRIQRSHGTTRSLLLHVNAVTGLGVQDLVPNAEIPYFDMELMGTDTIRLIFHGSVEARMLLEGLITGCALAYGEKVSVHAPPPLPARPDRRVSDFKIEDEQKNIPGAPAELRNLRTPPRGR